MIVEPVMRRIPEGWFSMGYAGGRDDEKPVHRVWVDAFELAAYQTTNEDYACFLACHWASKTASIGTTRTSIIRSSRSSQCRGSTLSHIANG